MVFLRRIRILMMLMITCVLFVQIIATESAGKGAHIPSFAGPVTVRLTQLCPCPEKMVGKNTVKISAIVKQTREQEKPRLYGTIENKEPLDYTAQMTLTLGSWSSVAGWIPNAFILRFDKLCTAVRSHFGSAVDIVEKYSVGGLKFCPRSAGNFTINGSPAMYNPAESEFKVLPYGRWRGHLSFYRKEAIGCIRVFFETTPRVKNADE